MNKLVKEMSEALGISEVPLQSWVMKFREEAFKALCFLCVSEGEPVSRDQIRWSHEHKGADDKVYSRSECRATQLRAYYSREDQ